MDLLETVLDSFFENYVKWMQANPQYNYDTYNVSFDNTRPKRTPETIKWADVIVMQVIVSLDIMVNYR